MVECEMLMQPIIVDYVVYIVGTSYNDLAAHLYLSFQRKEENSQNSTFPVEEVYEKFSYTFSLRT